MSQSESWLWSPWSWLSNATINQGKRFRVDEISTMRTRDLKNFLIQRVHLDSNVISKIIDKAELRKLALYYANEKNIAADVDSRIFLFYIGIACLTSVFLFIRNKSQILSAVDYVSRRSSAFINYELRINIKCIAILRNIKKFKFTEAVMIFITILIDLSIIYINLSTILSWILSSSSPIRKYFLPTLSFLLSSSMLTATNMNSLGQQQGI